MDRVEIDERKIEYSLIRKNVKNINLRIRREGTVVVSANPLVPDAVIKKFILDNAEKILNAIDKSSSQNYSFENGTKLKLLGKEYVLYLEQSKKNSYFISDDSITFYSKDIADKEQKRNIYDMLLTNTAKVIFPRLLEECYLPFRNICKSIPNLKIKDLKSQWGNCYHKRNLITLNIRLAAYDIRVIRSVVYHEYCHFVYQNHSKDFYDLLTKVCPNWKECDKVLKNKK